MKDVLLTDISTGHWSAAMLCMPKPGEGFQHFGIEVGMDEAWRQIGKGATS